MAQGETTITIVGNLTGDPDLRYTQAGLAVANFTVAATERAFDKDSREWKDGDTLFMRCSAWRDLAEHVASLGKGTRVIAIGRLKQRSYENKEGQTVQTTELEVDEIGPSLRYATATVTRAQSSRTQQDNRQNQRAGQQPQGQQEWAANQPGAGYDPDAAF